MGRSPCCEKKDNTKKGAWTQQEDARLVAHILLHGEGAWRSLPKAAGLLRCGKSCRLRWLNYLRPDVKRGNFSEEEDKLIIRLHSLLGNKWSLIAGRLPGRTDNEIKNHWSTHIKRKLSSRGFDPQTHRSICPPHNNSTAFNFPPDPEHKIAAFQSTGTAEITNFFQLEGSKSSPTESAASTDEEHPYPDINFDFCMRLPSNSAPVASSMDTTTDSNSTLGNPVWCTPYTRL